MIVNENVSESSKAMWGYSATANGLRKLSLDSLTFDDETERQSTSLKVSLAVTFREEERLLMHRNNAVVCQQNAKKKLNK